MYIRLTDRAVRGIGLRSVSTGKLTRYEAGDILEVSDKIAIGLINSGLATSEDKASDEAEDAEQQGGTEQSDDTEQKPYDAMSKEELIALCKEQGKSYRGTKEELIARLTED